MKGPKTQTIHGTNLGSYDIATTEKITGIPSKDGVHPLTKLHNDVAIATQMGPKDDEPVPVIETTEEVCVFLNTGKGARVDGFRKAGYFTYGDVVVCVEGTREATIQKLNSTRATSGANWVNATQGEEDFLKAEQVAAAEAGRAKR